MFVLITSYTVCFFGANYMVYFRCSIAFSNVNNQPCYYTEMSKVTKMYERLLFNQWRH